MASSTAAAQVFGLPELLEHILLYVGLNSYNDSSGSHSMLFRDYRGFTRLATATAADSRILKQIKGEPVLAQHATPQPATALFVLQRVNGTFRGVINGSRKLLELMRLRQPSDPQFQNTQVPLTWLLLRLGYEEVMMVNYSSDPSRVQLEALGNFDPKNTKRATFLLAGNETASWRQMVLATCRVIDWTLTSCRGTRFDVREGQTLGEVYENNIKYLMLKY